MLPPPPRRAAPRRRWPPDLPRDRGVRRRLASPPRSHGRRSLPAPWRQAGQTPRVRPRRPGARPARGRSLAAPWSESLRGQPFDVEDAEPERDEQAGDEPEPDDDRGLRPADELEVVLQRRHLEHAPAGHLE